MKYSDEQIAKAKQCKDVEELKTLAKQEGLEFSKQEAEMYFNITHGEELSDVELSAVAGGAKGDKWVLTTEKTHIPKCPFCGAQINFVFRLYENKKTQQRKYEMHPLNCSCGARINYDCFTSIFMFSKNGEHRRVG